MVFWDNQKIRARGMPLKATNLTSIAFGLTKKIKDYKNRTPSPHHQQQWSGNKVTVNKATLINLNWENPDIN